MAQCFALWVTVAMIGFLGAFAFWGYRKDKDDVRRYSSIRNEKTRVYSGLNLTPVIFEESPKAVA